MIRVAILEDHLVVIKGLQLFLEEEEGIGLVSVFRTAGEFLDSLDSLDADILLLDLNLPDIKGWELCQRIKARRDIGIICFSVHNEEQIIKNVLKNGASAYLQKNAEPMELIAAIRAVHSGDTYYCSESRKILEKAQSTSIEIPRITRREKEILQLIQSGDTSKEIARHLVISVHTVENHRKNLLEKFRVKSMASLLGLVTQYGLLD